MKGLLFTLLSRGLLILVLLGLVAGYYYRAALFPEFFAGSETVADTQTAQGPSTQAPPADSTPQPAPSAPAPAAPPAADAPDMAPPAASPAEAEPTKAEAPQTVVVTASEASPEPAAPAAELSGEGVRWPESPSDEPAEGQQDPAPSAPAPGTASEQGEQEAAVADSAAAAEATEGLTALERARNAYWAGKVKDALAAYQQAVAAHPDDPDAQGELGNLHFAEGNWQQAADAYLAAGQALLGRGDVNAAEHLVVVLEGLDPEHAKTLRQAIEQQRAETR